MIQIMKLTLLVFSLFLLPLTGCLMEKSEDITSFYVKEAALQKGYRLGETYVLQKEIFVTKGDRPDYRFTEPGDGVPTTKEWRAGVRKPQFFKVIKLLPVGTKLRVEKIIYLHASGSGVSHATGMLRAEGVDLLINPFSISQFVSERPYSTLCVPDERFLREEK